MMCQVRWGDNKLAMYINNKRVNYMGLYQVSSLPGIVDTLASLQAMDCGQPWIH